MAILDSKAFEVTLEEDDFECIVEMAGYGIGYWVNKAMVSDNLYTIEFVDPEDDEKTVVAEITPLMIARAWEKVINREVQVSEIYLTYLRSGDCGDVDADIADVLIQVAIFNEIIFG